MFSYLETFKPEQIQQVKPSNRSQPVQLQTPVVENRSIPTVLEAVAHKVNPFRFLIHRELSLHVILFQ